MNVASSSGVESYTRLLAEFVADRQMTIPESARHAAKRLILDTVGGGVAGAAFASSKIVRDVRVAAGGAPQATVLVTGDKLSVQSAANVNAHAANALDIDEGMYNSMHQAAVTILSALAAAEHAGKSGRDLVDAVAVGFEIAGRVILSLQQLSFAEDGSIEISPVLGTGAVTFGAAASVGRVLGLDADQMSDAFGLTGWMAPAPAVGRFGKYGNNRPMSKYGMYGEMASSGIEAVQLAQAGFVGDRDVLDGDRGFWKYMGSASSKWDVLAHGHADTWLIEQTSIKLYPSCRWSAAPVDLLLAIMKENDLRADELEQIDLTVLEPATNQGLDRFDIVTEVDGQFSIPFAAALAAQGQHKIGTWHSQGLHQDPEVVELAKKVHVHPLVSAREAFEQQLRRGAQMREVPAEARVRARGQVFEKTTTSALGDPWNPASRLSDDDLRAKFAELADGVLAPSAIAEASDRILGLDEEPDLSATVGSLVRRS